jgi:hypothetical protein
METERINRVGVLIPYGFSQYVQEVKKRKIKTVEKAEVYSHNYIEMADGSAERINYLV